MDNFDFSIYDKLIGRVLFLLYDLYGNKNAGFYPKPTDGYLVFFNKLPNCIWLMVENRLLSASDFERFYHG